MTGFKRLAGFTAGMIFSCQVYGQATVPGQTPAVGTSPLPGVTQRLPVSPAPFDPAPPPPSPPPGSPGYVPPPPVSDTRDGFSYSPSSEYEGFTTVYPTDGTEPLNVSSSFLDVTLRAGSSDEQILQSAKNYEKMNASIGGKFMDQFFPDSTAADANVQTRAIQGTNQDVVVEQDPLAGPYARVTVTDKEGNVISQSSVSAQVAADILNQPYFTAEQKIATFSKPDFLLPESARQNFSSLSAEQLRALVLEKPELANQEFIKAAQVAAAEKEKKAAREAARSSRDVENTGTTMTKEAQRAPFVKSTSPDQDRTIKDGEPGDKGTTAGSETSGTPDDTPDFWTRTSQSKTPLVLGGLVAIIAIGVFSFGMFRSRR